MLPVCMGVLSAFATSVSTTSEWSLLVAVGGVVSALAGLVAVMWQARAQEARGDVASPPPRPEPAQGDDTMREARRRAQAEARSPELVLTTATLRSLIREELAVIRDDIRQTGKRTFWSGFAQGCVFYVCGIVATVIISG
jgi:hypothetical protein